MVCGAAERLQDIVGQETKGAGAVRANFSEACLRRPAICLMYKYAEWSGRRDGFRVLLISLISQRKIAGWTLIPNKPKQGAGRRGRCA